MAFFAHAVGTATFPGLVLADGLGFAAPLGAFGAALVAAALVGLAARRRGVGTDSLTALVLAGSLALGVVLASDVFASQASVDRLLFGSLLTIDAGDLAFAVLVALVAVAASAVVGPRWLATGFAGEDGSRPDGRAADAGLVVLVALAAVAVLAATGALLATAILVVPAATTRLVTDRLRTWQFGDRRARRGRRSPRDVARLPAQRPAGRRDRGPRGRRSSRSSRSSASSPGGGRGSRPPPSWWSRSAPSASRAAAATTTARRRATRGR